MRNKWRQGYYKLQNPEKYVGDKNKIRYMSSWELSVHKFFDITPSILHWNSEGIRVPYYKPTDGKIHTYLPDYWVEYQKKDGTIIQELIEVKPKKQTRKSRVKDPKRKLYEDITYAVNLAKWTAAKKYATDRGWGFRILTEKDIYK
jgi:hypothetical protein